MVAPGPLGLLHLFTLLSHRTSRGGCVPAAGPGGKSCISGIESSSTVCGKHMDKEQTFNAQANNVGQKCVTPSHITRSHASNICSHTGPQCIGNKAPQPESASSSLSQAGRHRASTTQTHCRIDAPTLSCQGWRWRSGPPAGQGNKKTVHACVSEWS